MKEVHKRQECDFIMCGKHFVTLWLSVRYNEEGHNMELKTKMVTVHKKYINYMFFLKKKKNQAKGCPLILSNCILSDSKEKKRVATQFRLYE